MRFELHATPTLTFENDFENDIIDITITWLNIIANLPHDYVFITTYKYQWYEFRTSYVNNTSILRA